MAIKRSQNEERNAASYHDCRICTLLCVILRSCFLSERRTVAWENSAGVIPGKRSALRRISRSGARALLCCAQSRLGHSRQPRPTRVPIGIPTPFIRVSPVVLDVFFLHAPTAR